ncbi:MAG: hypothetical protein Ct9H300mP10_07140 [Methanobacteriota archaeon]|nr:MAG: hypothetical protein Ct9H300mP10_07140 [Euryarchaeota archaeon]
MHVRRGRDVFNLATITIEFRNLTFAEGWGSFYHREKQAPALVRGLHQVDMPRFGLGVYLMGEPGECKSPRIVRARAGLQAHRHRDGFSAKEGRGFGEAIRESRDPERRHLRRNKVTTKPPAKKPRGDGSEVQAEPQRTSVWITWTCTWSTHHPRGIGARAPVPARHGRVPVQRLDPPP